MTALLLAYVLFAGSDKPGYPPEEIDTRAIAACAGNGPLVLISRFLAPRLILFNFEEQRAVDLDDGRFRMLKGLPLAFENGFAIVAFRLGVVYFVDQHGGFLRQKRMADVVGWDSNFRIVHLTPDRDGVAYLTLKHIQDETLVFARLDLHEFKLTTITNRPTVPAYTAFWVGNADAYYWVVEDTGEVVRAKTQQVLLPARDPVPRPSKRARSPFHARLEYLSAIDTNYYFTTRNFVANSKDDHEHGDRFVLAVTKEGTETYDLFPYARYKDQWLVYDGKNEVFRVTSTLKEKPKSAGRK